MPTLSSGLSRTALALKVGQIKLATRSYLRDRTGQATSTVTAYAIGAGFIARLGPRQAIGFAPPHILSLTRGRPLLATARGACGYVQGFFALDGHSQFLARAEHSAGVGGKGVAGAGKAGRAGAV